MHASLIQCEPSVECPYFKARLAGPQRVCRTNLEYRTEACDKPTRRTHGIPRNMAAAVASPAIPRTGPAVVFAVITARLPKALPSEPELDADADADADAPPLPGSLELEAPAIRAVAPSTVAYP